MRRRKALFVTLFSLPLAGFVACSAPNEAKKAPVGDGATEAKAPVKKTAAAPAVTRALKVKSYPKARVSDHTDDYHGTQVSDPFRWLEDSDSDETKAWIAGQNEVTNDYLVQIDERSRIKKRLTALWNYERYGTPWKRGGRYFMSKNDGLQNQSVLYWSDRLDGDLKVMIDPNTLSDDGTVALNGVSVSDDGKYLAYGVSASGSDWQEWHVREIETGKDLDDHLKWIKFSSASWAPDSKGFFYGRFDSPAAGKELESVNYYQKLYYHKVGTSQDQDVLVYQDKKNKEWQFGADVTDDGKYVIIDVSVGTDRRNMVYWAPLNKDGKPGKVTRLIDKLEAKYVFVGNQDSVFWFRTDHESPRGKLIAIDIKKPDPSGWKTVIPESEDTLRSVSVVGERLIVNTMHDAHSRITVHDLDGKRLSTLKLPGIGTAGGFQGKPGDSETFYSFRSFTQPSTTYRYDTATAHSAIHKKPSVDIDPALYEVKQVFYKSKDGTKIPMFIVHRKGIELDGTHPTYLYAYGGFNVSLTPSFSVADMVWLEMGGIYAQPNLRGGGEYGESWHEAGTKLNKQNVFDDFVAAGEYLVAEGYTQKKKLAIGGRSNGGLLVGATITQHPEMFAAALPGVGVMDMLRFHKFTIGWAWVSDYGSSDNPEEFKALRAYSPLHNFKPDTEYPATMVFTADHDDRVVPLHSFKFAAELQHSHKGENPVLIRIETKAGHGAGKPTSKRIEQWADLWGFLVANLDMKIGDLEKSPTVPPEH